MKTLDGGDSLIRIYLFIFYYCESNLIKIKMNSIGQKYLLNFLALIYFRKFKCLDEIIFWGSPGFRWCQHVQKYSQKFNDNVNMLGRNSISIENQP